jgi:hypothetical protein
MIALLDKGHDRRDAPLITTFEPSWGRKRLDNTTSVKYLNISYRLPDDDCRFIFCPTTYWDKFGYRTQLEFLLNPLSNSGFLSIRYFTDSGGDDIGQHTMMLRRTFARFQKRQKRKYTGIIAVVVCLFIGSGTYAVFKHMESRKQRLLAEVIFYAMKLLELEFAWFFKTAIRSQDIRF